MLIIRGIPASPGYAIGPAQPLTSPDLTYPVMESEDPAQEWQRLVEASKSAQHQLESLRKKLIDSGNIVEADILHAQRMMLEDPELKEELKNQISNKGWTAERAIDVGMEAYANKLEQLEDDYLKARAADVRDAKDRVLKQLLGIEFFEVESVEKPSILMAKDLRPTETAGLDVSLVLGFCTAEGGRTSHTAILARGMGIPAMVGAGDEILNIPAGEGVILDGTEGVLIIGPGEELLSEYQAKIEARRDMLEKAEIAAGDPAITLDGMRVRVAANIGSVHEADLARSSGAEGVGLLRTEFLYMGRNSMPTEQDQYRILREIVDRFGDQPVVLRTLDIGGDKELDYLDFPSEANPFLGLRAIRLTLQHPELFKPQLRAALRAGADHDLKIMFPMVSTLEEFRSAKRYLQDCILELEDTGQPFNRKVQAGIMVEVPSAAIMAKSFAQEVDFFSIGTNDLSQYIFAADRTNHAVAEYADGLHPAVLHLIREVIIAAKQQGRRVGLCGELAGDPVAIPVLLGLGLVELSMNPASIPAAKQIIRAISKEQAAALAEHALHLESGAQVRLAVKTTFPQVNFV